MNSNASSNPLLESGGLPRFDAIAPVHVAPAIDVLLKAASDALEKVTQADFPADWATLASTLDVATERLSGAWGAVSHLNGVADTPELRAAYNEALPRVTEFWTRLGAVVGFHHGWLYGEDEWEAAARSAGSLGRAADWAGPQADLHREAKSLPVDDGALPFQDTCLAQLIKAAGQAGRGHADAIGQIRERLRRIILQQT